MTRPDPRHHFDVLLAQSGDRDALERLLKAHERGLARYLLGLLDGDEALAADVLQEVFVTIYRKLRWLREPAAFKAWAFRIATREAGRRLGRRRKRREIPARRELLEALPEMRAPPPELPSDQLESLVATASPASREVLLLHYGEDLTLAEVASVLGISPGTAKSRLAYGLSTLRKHLGHKRPKEQGS